MTDASIKDLKPRSLEIFHELVMAYLEDGLPVGSSRLAKFGKFDFSPASIRNKMSDLEDAGLLLHLIHHQAASQQRLVCECLLMG